MFLFLLITFCKFLIREEDIELLGSVIRYKSSESTSPENLSLEDAFKGNDSISFFYNFFVKSFQEENRLSGLLDMACSGEVLKYVYTSNVIGDSWLYEDDEVIAHYLVEIGKLCSDEYLNKPHSFSPKVDYYQGDKHLENLKSILIFTKALDKKAINIFFNLLDSRRLNPKDYLDLLISLGRNNILRAYGYLGDIYYYGLGVPKSVDKAMDMYLKGKMGGDPVSYNGIGRILMSSEYEDYGGAKNHFELASMSGVLNETDFRLYELYTNHFFMGDYGKFHLSKAVSMGFLPAIVKDGSDYFSRKDFSSAIIRLSPILDYTRPVIDLQNKANNYFKNKKYYFSLIANLLCVQLGSKSSLNNAIYLLEHHQLLRDQDFILFNLYIKQMREGSNKNLNRIGDCYFYGNGVKQSFKDAFSFYLSSAVLKKTEGILNVSYMYEKGLGVEKSILKSFNYLKKIKVDDQNYLLLFYVYIFFFMRVVIFNKYVLGGFMGIIVIYKVILSNKRT
nr:unnamed protein product [Papilio xuthus]